MIEHDVDPPCLTCGGRVHSGCVCPLRELTDAEREFSREMRLVRAELKTREAKR